MIYHYISEYIWIYLDISGYIWIAQYESVQAEYNIGSRHNIQQIQLELFSLTFYINPTEYFQYFLRHHSFSSSHIVGEKYFLSDSLKSCSKQIICYSETIIFRNNIQKIENNIFIYFFIYRYYIILSKEKL